VVRDLPKREGVEFGIPRKQGRTGVVTGVALKKIPNPALHLKKKKKQTSPGPGREKVQKRGVTIAPFIFRSGTRTNKETGRGPAHLLSGGLQQINSKAAAGGT